MSFKILHAVVIAGVLSAVALEAGVTGSIQALIGGSLDIYEVHLSDDLRVEDSFARTIEFPPGSLQEHFFGATVEVDAETGGFRGKSNLLAVSQSQVRWNGRIDVPIEIFGPSGPTAVTFDMTVRSNFSYDSFEPPGASTNAIFQAILETSTPVNTENPAFHYAYGKAGGTETLRLTPTGNVAIIDASRGYIEVILRTVLEIELFDGRGGFQLDASIGGIQNARGGLGGAINAFDSAFLTLSLPPGYMLDPTSRFLSKPFEDPQAIPEPWMTPLVGLAFTGLAMWRRGCATLKQRRSAARG